MQAPQLTDATIRAVLAANVVAATTGPSQEIRRLEPAPDGTLHVLPLAMDEYFDNPQAEADDSERPAGGYTAIAELRTWHPAYVGLCQTHTAAEVLVQLPADLSARATGVQFLPGGVWHPVTPTADNYYLNGWWLKRIRLYEPAAAEPELGMRVLSERVDHTYRDDKEVQVFDLEFLATGEAWTAEPLWSVPAAAAGLLVDYDRQQIGVVRQPRIGAGGTKLIEPVAGGVDDNEHPLTAFARESEEETGLRPTTVRRVAHLFVSAGRTDEVKTLTIGTDLVDGIRTEGAEIETIWFPIAGLDRMIELTADGGDQTLWGLLLWLWRELARTQPQLIGFAR